MSSDDEDYNDDNPSSVTRGLKKRRIQRACDICRKRKIRCDGVPLPGNRCSNCVAFRFKCTYIESSKKRAPPKSYVESLENRLEKLHSLLQKLCPDDNVLKEHNIPLDRDRGSPDINIKVEPGNSDPLPRHPRDIATSVIRRVGESVDSDDEQLLPEDDFPHLILADNLERLKMDKDEYRFFGKSSGVMLLQTAMELRNEYNGSGSLKPHITLGEKRPEFWTPHSWERPRSQGDTPNYMFPEPNLIIQLIDLYFSHVNLYLPLLHRPTFEKAIADNLHLTNNGFADTLLLVCALGSRFSDDPRVLLDGVESYHSCGWKWFDQVQLSRKSLFAPPTLYDLQLYCLSVQFLQGSSAPQSCWTMVGIGIRLAQEIGAHRRSKTRDRPVTAEDELWKRAFWVLVCLDRPISATLGRPCAIQDEDFDLDMPIECDDEYWDHSDPSQRFKQPPDQPSLITQFNLYIKLNQVLAFSLRTIYSINKSKILFGFVGPQWEKHIVAELDSALNKWVDSVPDHLRWDPNREDNNLFNQSVVLYVAYYHVQILVHRPFIPSPSKPSPLSFPSLAICTNAARSCSHIVDIHRKRNPMPPPSLLIVVFTSAIVLLLNIWGGKRSGLSTDPNKEMTDVHKCMQMLKMCEKQWHSAGRLWDILYELASAGDLPLPQPSSPAANKRERTESPIPLPTPRSDTFTPPKDAPRHIVGSRRVSKDVPMSMPPPPPQQVRQHLLPPPPQPQDHTPYQVQSPLEPLHQPELSPRQYFALPMYSNELVGLPLHGKVTFLSGDQPPLDHEIQNLWYPPMAHANGSRSNTANVTSAPNVFSSLYGYQDSNVAQINTMTQGYSAGDGEGGGIMDITESAALYEHLASLNYASGGTHPSAGLFGSPVGGAMSMDGMYGGQLSGSGNPHQESQIGLADVYPQQIRQEQLPVQYPHVDPDLMVMWSTAPTGFELDEWGTYLTNVSELTQGHQGPSQRHV